VIPHSRGAESSHSLSSATAETSGTPWGASPHYTPVPELQLIYDTAPVGLAFLTPDCRYVQVNQRLTEICGISPAEHIGRSVRETVPRVADQVEMLVEAVVRTGEPIRGVEVRGQRDDGRNADHVWITNWHPLKSLDGSVIGVNVVAEDVTERKHAEAVLAASEKALRESEARFRELADNMNQFAWTAYPDGRRYWYNKRWHEYAGTTLEEMQGFGWQKLHHPDHLERVVRHIGNSFENGVAWEDTFPLRGRDGNYRWFLSRAQPIRNEAGDIIRWLGTNTDVTEQIEAEKALRESEARFRELADNISQFAWTADQNGWIYWYNKRWHDYTGTTLAEMEGWGWQKVHHPEHVDRVVKRIRQSFESGTPWEDTFPLRGRDGTYRWFLSRALPIRDEAGEVVRWFGTNTDITEQIEAEKALRELNETLEQRVKAEIRERLQIWNVSQDLLVVADLEGKYLSVNPAWTISLGWSEDDLVGRTSQWLLHPDDRERTLAEIGHLIAGKKTLRFENRVRHKDGSYRWLSWKAVPDKGRIYAMARDVTDLRHAEESLRQMQRDLARVGRQTTLATMTASIAHEIKQPLTAIVANGRAGLRWLDREKPDLDEVRRCLKLMVDEGHRSSDVLTSIRGMFREDTQEKVSIDINDLLRQVLALSQGEIESQGVALELQLLESLPQITAERVPLQQVVLNLVTNAIEAMSGVKDRKRLLSIRTQMLQSRDVLITVADAGTGLDPRIIERIFEPFFTTKEQGMGIGLSICKSIVENQGGRLSASPASPHGAIFHIQLPTEGPID